MQAFANVIANVHSRNKTWSPDDAQSFVQMLVKENGLARLGDILAFKAVKSDSGRDASCLSFQTGYLPILEFLTSDLVLKSTIHKNINKLYGVVSNTCSKICDKITTCVGTMIAAKSWADPKTPSRTARGVVLFRTLTTLLLQLFARYKESRDQDQIVRLVNSLVAWFTTWSMDISSMTSTFQDSIASQNPRTKRLVIGQLREELDRLAEIVNRDLAQKEGKKQVPGPSQMALLHKQQARIAQLAVAYDPPGDLRTQGPRHDNDSSKISEIRIAPTHDELLSSSSPFLPVTLSDAPHHLPAHSMERHLDSQFRLLREELVAPIRSSIAVIFADLEEAKKSAAHSHHGRRTKLQQLFDNRGGAFKTSGIDSVFFHVYTGATFTYAAAEKRDLTVGIRIDTPPNGAARDKDVSKRLEYWRNNRRLECGSLVALVVVDSGSPKVFLGVVSSTSRDLADSARMNNQKVQLRMSFFDPEVELMALRRQAIQADNAYGFLVDNNIVYEATRPFLARLQTMEPADVPFARYLTDGSLAEIEVSLPKYATAPDFRFKLKCLAKNIEAHHVADMDVSQASAIQSARQQLLDHSTLDPSQVDAVVHSLTREVSLIQGYVSVWLHAQ
ncbi:uncharacterized protein PHACADRAFT_203172 [Phanerochaete carnosa HHB-10118-sp]|uniref:Uncharacterized protein n=1 Tax=Phanerochaete carnosa (strain HHB-10118-sp) TaxID=650164 RepID=K5UFC8_PHACS|nr:uncharacterized protein PHACADRAFT_203172 [Phanerochaete carnosa HHB-10118-sp]EKM48156.1 hypothetical protein PHACADRAFT_203172 [Phanerochaete carnosa HHB-10118-sp]